MQISVDELRELTVNAIKSYGYNDNDTAVISEALLYAQLRGNNQGIAKLIGKGIPVNADAGNIATVKDTPISARIDGGQNHSMVVLDKAVAIAISKAKASGFGMVGTFNTSTSSGAIGYFADRIATAGFIGQLFSSPPPRVAACGSYEPIFGTNPIAVGIPTCNHPVVLDMSTAAMSFYGLVEAKTASREIPGDVAYDSEGHLTTSPEKAISGGALRSFDRGPKGSGLALLTEIMAGPLVGSFIRRHRREKQLGPPRLRHRSRPARRPRRFQEERLGSARKTQERKEAARHAGNLLPRRARAKTDGRTHRKERNRSRRQPPGSAEKSGRRMIR